MPCDVEHGMVMRPLMRYAGLYAAVELAAVIALTWAIGIGWTLVVLAAAFIVGVVLAAAQLRGQVGAIRRSRSGSAAVADGVLVALGSLLVFLPGLVSTAAGALMLAPPTRTAMRPLAAALVSRGVLRGMNAINLGQVVDRGGRGDYIDGEVIDGPVRRPAEPRTVIARRIAG
jgi:UPF0716 protein FxsA